MADSALYYIRNKKYAFDKLANSGDRDWNRNKYVGSTRSTQAGEEVIWVLKNMGSDGEKGPWRIFNHYLTEGKDRIALWDGWKLRVHNADSRSTPNDQQWRITPVNENSNEFTIENVQHSGKYIVISGDDVEVSENPDLENGSGVWIFEPIFSIDKEEQVWNEFFRYDNHGDEDVNVDVIQEYGITTTYEKATTHETRISTEVSFGTQWGESPISTGIDGACSQGLGAQACAQVQGQYGFRQAMRNSNSHSESLVQTFTFSITIKKGESIRLEQPVLLMKHVNQKDTTTLKSFWFRRIDQSFFTTTDCMIEEFNNQDFTSANQASLGLVDLGLYTIEPVNWRYHQNQNTFVFFTEQANNMDPLLLTGNEVGAGTSYEALTSGTDIGLNQIWKLIEDGDSWFIENYQTKARLSSENGEFISSESLEKSTWTLDNNRTTSAFSLELDSETCPNGNPFQLYFPSTECTSTCFCVDGSDQFYIKPLYSAINMQMKDIFFFENHLDRDIDVKVQYKTGISSKMAESHVSETAATVKASMRLRITPAFNIGSSTETTVTNGFTWSEGTEQTASQTEIIKINVGSEKTVRIRQPVITSTEDRYTQDKLVINLRHFESDDVTSNVPSGCDMDATSETSDTATDDEETFSGILNPDVSYTISSIGENFANYRWQRLTVEGHNVFTYAGNSPNDIENSDIWYFQPVDGLENTWTIIHGSDEKRLALPDPSWAPVGQSMDIGLITWDPIDGRDQWIIEQRSSRTQTADNQFTIRNRKLSDFFLVLTENGLEVRRNTEFWQNTEKYWEIEPLLTEPGNFWKIINRAGRTRSLVESMTEAQITSRHGLGHGRILHTYSINLKLKNFSIFVEQSYLDDIEYQQYSNIYNRTWCHNER